MWSDAGDSHVMIVQYTGAIRIDLTLDPDDPRFQAFSVGYGTSAQAAEEAATRLDARFSTHADRSGYDVLVAESWAVSAGAVPGAASEADEPGSERLGQPDSRVGGGPSTAAPPSVDLETCAGKPVGSECWMEVLNQPGCHLWNPGLAAGATVTWNGGCLGGYAHGPGTVHWRYDDGQQTWEGRFLDGRRDGVWVFQHSEGWLAQGTLRRGQRHGTWIWCRQGRSRRVEGVEVYANGAIVQGFYSYDEIDDRQLAAEAASICARLLPDGRSWTADLYSGRKREPGRPAFVLSVLNGGCAPAPRLE